MYKRGTLAEYEADHLADQQAQGWTQDEIDNGKISKDINRNPKPDACRTTKIYDAIAHPENANDYIWKHSTGTLDLNAVKAVGWFPDIEE